VGRDARFSQRGYVGCRQKRSCLDLHNLAGQSDPRVSCSAHDDGLSSTPASERLFSSDVANKNLRLAQSRERTNAAGKPSAT